MTNLLECLQEVLDLGPGYFIRTDASGPYRPSQWEPGALLADIRHECPLVLEDEAWTEWSTVGNASRTCYINYGRFGISPSHQALPGYGHVRAYELSQRHSDGQDIMRIHPSRNRYLLA